MRINEKNAKKFFLECFPDGKGEDYMGRKMHLEDYNKNKETGWNIDHILALSQGGTNAKENLQCTNVVTNHVKGSKIEWIDNNVKLKVSKLKNIYKVVKVDETIYNLTEKDFAVKLFKCKYPLGVGYDRMGRKIILEDYLNKDIYSGWDIVVLNPNNKKITDERNYEVLNLISISEKKDKTAWFDNGRYYQVERSKGSFKIVEVIHTNGYTSRK